MAQQSAHHAGMEQQMKTKHMETSMLMLATGKYTGLITVLCGCTMTVPLFSCGSNDHVMRQFMVTLLTCCCEVAIKCMKRKYCYF